MSNLKTNGEVSDGTNPVSTTSSTGSGSGIELPEVVIYGSGIGSGSGSGSNKPMDICTRCGAELNASGVCPRCGSYGQGSGGTQNVGSGSGICPRCGATLDKDGICPKCWYQTNPYTTTWDGIDVESIKRNACRGKSTNSQCHVDFGINGSSDGSCQNKNGNLECTLSKKREACIGRPENGACVYYDENNKPVRGRCIWYGYNSMRHCSELY